MADDRNMSKTNVLVYACVCGSGGACVRVCASVVTDRDVSYGAVRHCLSRHVAQQGLGFQVNLCNMQETVTRQHMDISLSMYLAYH